MKTKSLAAKADQTTTKNRSNPKNPGCAAASGTAILPLRKDSPVEILPLVPMVRTIVIARVAVRFTLPEVWQGFIESRGISVEEYATHVLCRKFTEAPELCGDLSHVEKRLIPKFAADVAIAMRGAMIEVEEIMPRRLWEVIEEAASKTGQTSHFLLLVLLMHAINCQGQREREREISNREAAGKTAVPPAPGKVIGGPWRPLVVERVPAGV